MSPKHLCIYHHPCADGFAAAWAMRRFFGDAIEFHPTTYGEAPPDVTGRTVFIVDFSYKRDALLQIAGQASSITILDHHASAQRELVDLPTNVHTIFKMHRSGCMLTWEFLFPGEMPPVVFDHIEDRDLWKFALRGTREIVAGLYSYPMDFTTWDDLIPRVRTLHDEGRVLMRNQDKTIADLIKTTRRRFRFGELTIPVANVPYMYASEVAGQMAVGHPFAATYFDTPEGRKWSLRSAPDGANVSLIAEAMGGGGHDHAAGFFQTREEAIDFEVDFGVIE